MKKKMKMKINKILILKSLSLLIIFLVISNNRANAGMKEEMKKFLYDNVNSNYSTGGAYKTQSRGYYATPSVYSRHSVVEIDPLSINYPSFRSGCGGIDMFAGSFSHISADQFINLMKAIPSNAVGYAFDLALETISPAIKDVKDRLESVMNFVNSDNLNSCDLGKSIVNSGLSQFEKGSEILCIRKQLESGRADDHAEARKNCTSGGEKSPTLSNNTSDTEKIVDINYAWDSLKRTSFDRDMKEFIQTITGTIIVTKGANDNTPVSIKTYPSLATDTQTFNAMLYGGTMKKYACDEEKKCLNILNSGSHTVDKKDGFFNKIKNTLTTVSNKMLSRNAGLTDGESEMLSTTDVPVVTILRTYNIYFRDKIDSMISEALAEIIAHDLLSKFLEQNLEIVKKITKMGEDKYDFIKITQFQESIEKAKSALNKIQYKMQKKRETLLNEIDRAQKVEKTAKEILVGDFYN